MQRVIYALPSFPEGAQVTEEEEKKKLMEVYTEMEELR